MPFCHNCYDFNCWCINKDDEMSFDIEPESKTCEPTKEEYETYEREQFNKMTREFWSKQYTLGYLDALYDFAHYKDGEMFVGNCGRRYKDEVAEIEAKALCLTREDVWNYTAVDVTKEKPEIMGWYNIVAESSPQPCGRVFFDGKEFQFSKATITFADLLNNNTKIYWLKRI